jgi:sulfur-oxidizing protein SoxZ
MESGQRKGSDGKTVPRKIINRFTASFNGKPVFSADWHPAISANPYQSFFFKATESGELTFTWRDDDGSEYTAKNKRDGRAEALPGRLDARPGSHARIQKG